MPVEILSCEELRKEDERDIKVRVIFENILDEV
jgi:hypothetical protein